jgi:hypothetical protein
VAVNDYIAQGGSGFAVLKRNTTKFNTGISLRDALVDYIRTLPTHHQNPALCDPAANTNIVGVGCKDAQGESFDCTASCCCHDPSAGDSFTCSTQCAAFTKCAAMGMSPAPYDYRDIACLDGTIDPHDGRIEPIVGGGGQ